MATATATRKAPGSSPRARGAACSRCRYSGPHGTIPACAGSSPARCRPPACTRDHPRVRGEQEVDDAHAGVGRGPSPRARGADAGQRLVQGLDRTIPACAGSSRRRRRGERRGWDHPRVRGEQHPSQTLRVIRLGPSPRARGAGEPGVPAGRLSGTIPACAGSRLRDLGVCRGGARFFMTFVESGVSHIARIAVIGCRSGGAWRRCSSRVVGWWSVRGRGAWLSGGG